MSIQTEVTRLQTIRNSIRTKLIGLKIITKSDASLEECKTAIEGIADNGAVAGTIAAKDVAYTVPKGYHSGTGKVQIAESEKQKLIPGNIKTGIQLFGVEGSYEGAGAKLQSKNVTPSKAVQNVTADEGYEGLSVVNVGAIPDQYAVVTGVTSKEADVLANKIFVDADGNETAGTMVNNGAVNKTIDGLTETSYAIPIGYHSGTGTVSLTDDIETALAAI